MKLKSFFVRFLHLIIVALTIFVMIDIWGIFLIISLIFFAIGGAFEWLIMSRSFIPAKPVQKRKNSFSIISQGFMWVHQIRRFIAIEKTTIYDFRKVGYFPSIVAYLIMFLYVFIASIFYLEISYFACIIYILPIITNLITLIKYKPLKKK